MRVLIFNVSACHGSTGRIVEGLYSTLRKQGHEVRVCYRGTKEKHINNQDFIALGQKRLFYVSSFLSRLTGLESHFNFVGTRKAKKLIKEFKPDLVQLYNIHGNYINFLQLLSFLKKNKLPVVYSMVDEFPYMGKCAYPVDCEKYKKECKGCPQLKEFPVSWYFDTSNYFFHKKENIYKDFHKLVFTGPPFVCSRAKESYLLKDKCVVELDEPFNFEHYYPRDTQALRKALGIGNEERVIVCASGTQSRKRGKIFLDVASRLSNEKNLRFVFIGYDRNDWQFPNNIIVKGFISDQNELADYLSMADAYVCTSISDTTPSVCLGALGCGTRLIGFDYGGVMDCAPNEFGTYVPIGDLDAMARTVAKTQKKTPEDVNNIRTYAVERFSPSEIYNKQLTIYYSLINQ